MSEYRLPQSTRIDYVHLRTAGLSSMLDFYSTVLGLQEVRREGETVHLAPSAAAAPLIILTKQSGALPRPAKTAGLFHTAFLFPDRKDLAAMFVRLNECRYPFEGFADHGVSEALYLSDPDGNGLELYVDRPRSQWPFVGKEVQMVTNDLAIDGLIASVPKNFRWAGIHPQTAIGHIHLSISDLQRAEAFYCRDLGFNVMQSSYPGALFVSAGGYHHHIGLNTWTGRGTKPASDNAAGLLRFGITLGNHGAFQAFTSHLRSAGISHSSAESSVLCRDRDNIEIEVY